MILPVKAYWKAASDKEVAKIKKNIVYILVPATTLPTGHKIIGSRWVYKFKANKPYKGRVVVLEWEQLPGVDQEGTFSPVYRRQRIRMVLMVLVKYDFECWQFGYNTTIRLH